MFHSSLGVFSNKITVKLLKPCPKATVLIARVHNFAFLKLLSNVRNLSVNS